MTTGPGNKISIPRVSTKYAVLLDCCNGRLHPLAREFKALGFEVLRTESIEAALSAMGARPLRSLVAVVINESVNRRDMAALVAELTRTNTVAPILWISAPDSLATQLPMATGSRVLSSDTGPRALTKAASELLQDYLYPEQLAAHLSAFGRKILLESFSTNVDAHASVLKANGTTLGSMHASISFVGDRIRGNLLVSSTPSVGHSVWQNVFGREPSSREQVVDLFGEICNQILGRLRRCLDDETVRMAMPVLLRGQELQLRTQCPQPALVVPLRHELGFVYISLRLEHAEDDVTLGSPNEEHLLEGELEFL